MSWILGYLGPSLSREMRERLASLHGEALNVSAAKDRYLACGGLSETCQFGRMGDEDGRGWAVVGVGIRPGDRHCHVLTASDWRQRLSSERANLDGLGGHFVAVRWGEEGVEAYTDLLGIRSLYVADVGDGRAISTRPEWLAALLGGCSVDFKAFGAHWLAVNQLGTASFCKGIHRLGAGSYLRLDEGLHRAALEPGWMFAEEQKETTSSLRDTLRSFLYPDDPRTISLGLSGGLDSRLLLALRASHAGFATHTFGPMQRADVRIAEKVAAAAHVAHSHINLPVPGAEEAVSLLEDHSTHVQAVSPASSCIDLRYFPQLRLESKLLVDGGFGEIARRQFLNRLLHRDRGAVLAKDAERMLAQMRVVRADVFTKETDRLMYEGAVGQLAHTLAHLPDPQAVGVENFMDALSARTRLPNFFGFEQARLDHVVLNFMPYAQPAVIQSALAAPVDQRRGGRFARNVIREAAPPLGRIALVKGQTTFPFGWPALASRVFTSARKRILRPPEDSTRLEFLGVMREYAMDRLESAAVRHHGAYDQGKLRRLVEGYYAGDGRRAGQVDWWLAFETWRSAVENPASNA